MSAPLGRLTVSDLGFEPPSFSTDVIARITRTWFGITGVMKPLHGERDQNTRITDTDGRQYVLKISGATEKPESVDFQVGALLHIQQTDPKLPVPHLIAGTNGDVVQLIELDGFAHQVRLVTYLPGIPFMDGPFPTETGLRNFGRVIARLSNALKGYTHPASREFMPWDIGNGLVFSDQFRDLIPETVRPLCRSLIDRIEQEVYPRMARLRKQVIHQDGHGGNVLRPGNDSDEVSGIIDFGDMVHGPVLSDLAIAVSHFMESGRDPLKTARAVCEGFESIVPLTEEEIHLLLDLVVTRQILTLQLFEFRRVHMPHKPAIDHEEKPRIIRSLEGLTSLDRHAFAAGLRTRA